MTVRQFLDVPPMNRRGQATFPPVVCVRAPRPGKAETPVFRWHDGSAWRAGDELPAAIAGALPMAEAERCVNHAWTRMGMRRRSA